MSAKPKPRVFLDSNVIFSGLYSAQGAPGIILERFIKGDVRVVVSPQVLEEVIRTINEKLPEALPALRNLLINAAPEVTADPGPEKIHHWSGRLHPADAAILAAAEAAQPDFFVTGDTHFLKHPGIVKGTTLRIITPARFLEIIELNNA